MTKQEFLDTASRTIFKEVAKATNQLTGQSKTSSMVANLFASLPFTIEARFVENLPKPTKQLNALDEFVTAYMKHDDVSKVYIAFFYSTEKQLKQILKRIEKYPVYFAYLYMREALKISRLMGTKTHYKMMSGIIKHHKPHIPVERHYRLSLVACSYAVNNTLQKLFKASALNPIMSEIFIGQNFNSFWMNDNLSEMDILVKLLSDTELINAPQYDLDSFSYCPDSNLIFPGSFDNEISYSEDLITDLGETVSNAFASMSRGTTSAQIFEESFAAKKVKTGWFKKLAAKFSKDVHYATNTFRAEWSSLNITYRHKFKAPQHTHESHKLSIILSIDHSGSVATEGLSKLFYLFAKHSKQISSLQILIHDTKIIKEYSLAAHEDIAANEDFQKALANRVACGGTSHYFVFSRIAEMIHKKTIDPTKTIYIRVPSLSGTSAKSGAGFRGPPDLASASSV